MLDALGKTASEIRNKLGESLSTVQKFDTPLEQATTPSLEALKAFSSGVKVMGHDGDSRGYSVFQACHRTRPEFRTRLRMVGPHVCGYRRISASLSDYIRKAYELRDRTSEPEKYFISARFHKGVTGNMEKAEQTCELWIQAYPRAEMPHGFLAGAIYRLLGTI